jgi:HSP20 family molecular chaperone IbpA
MSEEQHPPIRVTVGNVPGETSSRTSPHESLKEPPPAYTPLIDIHESAEGLTLEADLPGATPQNLSIELADNVLTLHARIDSPAPEGARLLHEEYRVGDFYRSFILSDEVDRDKIKAELNQGVLRLTLPKAERTVVRRIEIKS